MPTLALTLLPLSYLALVSIPLMVIDVREHRLPNWLVLPGYLVLLVAMAGVWLTTGNFPWVALAAAIGYFVFLYLLAWLGGMGMGDVKLIAGITLALAWFSPLLPAVAILVAFVAAGTASLALLALRKTRMGSSIALGPYLLFGFVVCFIAQGWS